MFRITKNIHNILQGVSHPDQRIAAEEKQAIIDWITENANRYWFSEGGPLRPAEEGGADVVIVRLPHAPTLPYSRCASDTDEYRLMIRKCLASSL